mmetsp:Transcript_15375/g.31092  ORF Transcript_15375/g.31092 Transcript_15375/m.31092 type:complete len:270 (-) Transcript_15375:831-1640(-)
MLRGVGPLGASQQSARQVDKRPAEVVGRLHACCFALLCQVMQRQTHVARHARVVLQPQEQRAFHLRWLPRLRRPQHHHPHLRLDESDVVLADTRYRPRGGVPHLYLRVLQQSNHHRHRLGDERRKQRGRRALEDGAESERRGLAPMPIGGDNVRLDESHHGLHDQVLSRARCPLEASGRSHGEVPAVPLLVLLLLTQCLEQHRHQRRYRAASVVLRAPLGRPVLYLRLLFLLHQLELLVANRRPELDGLLPHLVLLGFLRRALDALQCE